MSSERKSVTISMEPSLFEELENLRIALSYTTRSKFYQDALVDFIASHSRDRDDQDSIAVITILFDHEDPEVQRALTSFQHSFPPQVLFSTHVHLTASLCMDVIFAKGTGGSLTSLCNDFRRHSGVKHVGSVFLPSTLLSEETLPFLRTRHSHSHEDET